MMGGFLETIRGLWEGTALPAQLAGGDWLGLATNPFFFLPVVILVGYLLYRQNLKGIVLLCLAFGLWVFFTSSYMDGLIINNELQLDKVWPLVGVSIIALAVLVWVCILGG